jgi:hypothetical protein
MPMLTFDSLPQARVVRKGGQQFAPPPAPRVQPEPSALRESVHNALAVLIGLWPLTAIVLLCTGLVIMAGNNGAP